MKRKSFYLLALSALMLSGCSNETDLFGEDPNGGPEGAKQQVTFLFPGTAQGVVPYAGGTASEAENEIKTLDVYVFGADKLATTDPKYLLEDVIKLTPETGGGLTVTGEDMKAAVSFVGTNRKCLYFVANGAGQTELNDYELGVTDTLTFIKKQTTSLGTGLLKAPLLMTGRYTFKADAVDAKKDDLTAPAEGHNVILNRRVARFDIRNDSEESTLEIEKILIKNTRPGAYLFAFGDGDATVNPAIPPTRPAYTGTLIPQLMELDFLSFPTANTGTTGSVFYVYPNAAGTIAANDFTSFELKGRSTQSQEVMVQPVKMQLVQKDDPATTDKDESALLPINPNTRYTISILATGLANVEATITVKEWVVGEKVDVEAGFGQVKMTLTEDKPDDGIELTDSKLLTVPSGETTPFGINVAADTEWEIVEKDAELTWMAITDRPTPGADENTPGEVGKKFTLEITKANPSTEAREQVLHIRNVKRPSIVQTLTVQQAGNTANGFKVTGEKLENNTLLFFGSADVTTLTLTLPKDINSFDATAADTWIILEKGTAVTRAIEGNLLKVSVAANVGDTERKGTFTIKVGLAEQIIEVKQAPRNLGNIVVNAVGIMNGELTYKGADVAKKSLLVRALTEWKVTTVYFANIADEKPIEKPEPTDLWITNGVIELKQAEAQTRTNYNGQYNFTPVANTTFIKRKAQMTVENIHDDKIKQTITIFQEGKLETLILAGTGDVYTDDVLQFAAGATAGVELTATSDNTGGALTALTATASDGSWVTIDVAGNIITVTPKSANDNYTERTSKVTVKMANANDKVFTVKQAGKAAPTFTVSGDGLTDSDLSLVAAGVTDAEYTVLPTPAVYTGLTVVKSGAAADWLTLTSTTVATDGKFTLTAVANDTGAARTATLTVTLPNALNTQVITVTQAAAVVPDPSFTVSGTGLTGTAPDLGFAMANTVIAAETFTVGVKDAVHTDLSIVQQAGTESWLTLDKTSLTNDGTFTLAATANSDQTPRTATISISLEGVDTPTVITVTQAKADTPKTPSFTVSGTGLTASSTTLAMANTVIAAETYTVTLTDATADAVSVEKTGTDADWLTLDYTAGEATFILAATANDGVDAPARTATITVKVTGAADHVITVTQAAATATIP